MHIILYCVYQISGDMKLYIAVFSL